MGAINLFQGGSANGTSSDCGCGPYPSTYPAATKVAVHYKPQHFTLADQFNPGQNRNQRCLMEKLAGTAALQTAQVIGQKMALLRIPAKHLVTHLRHAAVPGSFGAGITYDAYADLVNPETGAVVSSVSLPAALAGNSLAAAIDEFIALAPANGGLYTGDSALEIGVTFLTGPTSGTLAGFDGVIGLVAKVDGFDFGRN
jgi:hypothetical protein